MKKVALLIASLGMVSGVAVAHHGGSHQGKAVAKPEAGFRFAVGTPDGEVNCHPHDVLPETGLRGTHCHVI